MSWEVVKNAEINGVGMMMPPDPADDFGHEPGTLEVAGNILGIPESWRPPTMSRRSFLRGVICSGVVIASSGYLFSSSPANAGVKQAERLISLSVNGRKHRLDVAANETLAHTLRYRLGLTGTKLGCNRAECGACTVIIGEQTEYSCSTLTMRCQGKNIRTVEGVAQNGRLHPVQQAFIDELGPQCGFCTPGQVMSAVNLLEKNPKPTVDEVRQALSGNLCRCGAYEHYLNGVMNASRRA
jgi:aerobic-type carbon monoxide dehydrogenase small subunit (CoxS/CutS family)